MIVADAGWIIALRDSEDAHHRAAVAIANATIDEEVLLHPVTLAECLVGPAKMGVLDEAAAALRVAYEITEVEPDAPIRWARLRAETTLRLPDTIVLDTGIEHGASAIVTFDDRLSVVSKARGIDVPR